MSIELLGTLLVLALVDSTSIGTLVIPVWLLLVPGRVRVRRIGVYLATVVAFYLALGLALAFGARVLLDPVLTLTRGVGSSSLGPAVDVLQTVVGAALVGWGFWIGRRRPESGGGGKVMAWRDRALDSGGLRPLVALALAATLLEVATMLPYLGAIGVLTAARPGPAVVVLTMTGYCLVMVLPAVVLTAARVLAGSVVQPALERLGAWMERNAGETAAWIVGIVGFLVAFDALGRLGVV